MGTGTVNFIGSTAHELGSTVFLSGLSKHDASTMGGGVT